MELTSAGYLEILDNLQEGLYFVDGERRITFWNKAAERLSGYGRDEVIGRSCADNLLVHVDTQGRNLCTGACPVADCIENPGARQAELFLHHKDGHRVRVQIEVAPIRDRLGKVIGAMESFRESSGQEAILQRIAQLEEMAMLDPLTRLANRAHTESTLQQRVEEFQRYGWAFGVLFIDIDHFKQINDTHGHDTGDRVLAVVSKTLSNCLRPFDLIGRWGGEEFLAIVLQVDEEKLGIVANRALKLVERSQAILDGKSIQVTISIGATLIQPDDSAETVFKRADTLLYRSKHAGRNRFSLG